MSEESNEVVGTETQPETVIETATESQPEEVKIEEITETA